MRVFTLLFGLFLFQLLPGQSLVEAVYLETKTSEQLTEQYGGVIQAEYDADYYKILYTTPDTKGVTDTASGLLIVPKAEGKALPLLVDQHGTASRKDNVPSRGNYGLAELGAVISKISVGPDLLGLGDSRGFHPFVHAATTASASVDMLLAVRDFLDQQAIAYTDQLFLTGYSQGGYSSAAFHRELEANYADEFTVTAAAHMAGPHSLSGEMLNIVLSDEPYGFPGFFPYTYLSYNLVYEIYDSTVQAFKQPYAEQIDLFSDWSISLDSLNRFLVAQLSQDAGAVIPKFMLQDSVLQVLESRDPAHPLIRALTENDLLDWVPQAPTRFIHCSGDELIPIRNSFLADSIMNEKGAPDVALIDPSATGTHGGCVFPALFQVLAFFSQFEDTQTNTLEAGLPEVSLFPNPAGERIHIQNVPEGSLVELYGPDGRLVRQRVFPGGTATLEVSGLPGGLYLLRLRSGQATISRRVLIR